MKDTASANISFNQPVFDGNEFQYLREVLDSRRVSGDGVFAKRCEKLLESLTGCNAAYLATSCTAALEMAALLLDIQAGDEIIVPSFTFVSTLNAFILRGAVPRFVDIRPDTLNINETLIEDAITPKTKCIVVVHYAGVACEMDAIMAIADRYSLPVVEDNAHGLFGRYKGQPLGTFGVLATQSFHETKNITCGEGGALLINDPSMVSRAQVLREKGTDRTKFFQGLVDKYTWVDLGSSYILGELLAAVLLAQLERRDAIQNRRQEIWRRYFEVLSRGGQSLFTVPTVPADCDHPAHLFYLLLRDRQAREAFMSDLRKKGVSTVFHYLPLHTSPMGEKFGYKAGDLPVTESVADRLVRLPLHADMNDDEQERVVNGILEHFGTTV